MCLWDVRTQKMKMPPLVGHADWVQCVAFSADGKMIASASGHPGVERAVRLWDASTGAPLGVLHGHSALLTWVAFSPDGRWLASSSHDGTVRIWDPKSMTLVRVLE